MLRSKIVSVVNICASHGWAIVAIAAILTVLCGYYSAINFTIDTNVNKLISNTLDWRKNELALDAAFPYRHETIVAVVEAPTSELASQATAELIDLCAESKDLDPRLAALAQTAYEEAAMWAVKLVTTEEK